MSDNEFNTPEGSEVPDEVAKMLKEVLGIDINNPRAGGPQVYVSRLGAPEGAPANLEDSLAGLLNRAVENPEEVQSPLKDEYLAFVTRLRKLFAVERNAVGTGLWHLIWHLKEEGADKETAKKLAYCSLAMSEVYLRTRGQMYDEIVTFANSEGHSKPETGALVIRASHETGVNDFVKFVDDAGGEVDSITKEMMNHWLYWVADVTETLLDTYFNEWWETPFDHGNTSGR